MAKPIIFQIEFTGYQSVRVFDGEATRPVTAAEMATQIKQELEYKFHEFTPDQKNRLKVNIKRLA